MDPFETLQINAHQIKLVCEAACEELFGTPIDYLPYCPPDSPAVAQSSMGPQNMLWRDVEMRSRLIIRNAWGGGNNPSPFKILAAVSIGIITKAPIPEFFSDKQIKDNKLPPIAAFSGAPAAIIALDYSLTQLHKTKVGSDFREISAPLRMSNHYYLDLIAALTLHGKEIRCHSFHPDRTKVPFSMLSLIFEALAYKSNDIENPDIITFSR